MDINDLKPGDLILVRGGNHIIGEIIDEFENHGTYSHVAGFVKDDIIIEANGTYSAAYNSIYNYVGKADVYRCSIVTEEERQRIIDYTKNQITIRGKYDWKLIFILAFNFIFKRNFKYKEPFNEKICSVLWRDAYKSAGVDLCYGIDYPNPQQISKSDLLWKIGSI